MLVKYSSAKQILTALFHGELITEEQPYPVARAGDGETSTVPISATMTAAIRLTIFTSFLPVGRPIASGGH
ncbi:hypothetical protein GCM10023107_00920 [Actinoplanes octamycinicus]|nr:hypothetical protein Aoc01nite_92230 [Actinoplanes octamycinicus]